MHSTPWLCNSSSHGVYIHLGIHLGISYVPQMTNCVNRMLNVFACSSRQYERVGRCLMEIPSIETKGHKLAGNTKCCRLIYEGLADVREEVYGSLVACLPRLIELSPVSSTHTWRYHVSRPP